VTYTIPTPPHYLSLSTAPLQLLEWVTYDLPAPTAAATSLVSCWNLHLIECPTAVNIFLLIGAEGCASTTCQSLLLPTNFSLHKLDQGLRAIIESELWGELEAPPAGTCRGQGSRNHCITGRFCTGVKWRCLFAPVMVFMVHLISTTWWHLLHQIVQGVRPCHPLLQASPVPHYPPAACSCSPPEARPFNQGCTLTHSSRSPGSASFRGLVSREQNAMMRAAV
jgi:hypothetical protein